MSMFGEITANSIAKAIEKRAAEIQPKPIIGDDDSIFLTAEQQGRKDGLLEAASIARQHG